MRKFVVAFLIFASINAYSKQTEKITFKQIHELIPKQDILFICKIEASTGFAYQDGKWQATQFETGEKFLLRELTKDDPGFDNRDKTPYGVFDVGDKVPQMYCTVNEESGTISCNGIGQLFFSIETGQFLRIEAAGSVSPEDVTYKRNPKMMHGSCLLKRDVPL